MSDDYPDDWPMCEHCSSICDPDEPSHTCVYGDYFAAKTKYLALSTACEDLVQTVADHSSEAIGSLAIIDAIDSIERLIK